MMKRVSKVPSRLNIIKLMHVGDVWRCYSCLCRIHTDSGDLCMNSVGYLYETGPKKYQQGVSTPLWCSLWTVSCQEVIRGWFGTLTRPLSVILVSVWLLYEFCMKWATSVSVRNRKYLIVESAIWHGPSICIKWARKKRWAVSSSRKQNGRAFLNRMRFIQKSEISYRTPSPKSWLETAESKSLWSTRQMHWCSDVYSPAVSRSASGPLHASILEPRIHTETGVLYEKSKMPENGSWTKIFDFP